MTNASTVLSLYDLPCEVQVRVAWLLGRVGACQLDRTCRNLHHLSHNDALWHQLYISDWGQHNGESDTWPNLYRKRYIKRTQEIATFNSNPKVVPGIPDWLGSPDKAKNTERYIIEFLQERRVTRIARGEYLGFEDTRVSGVLAAYFNTFDFTDQTVLDALTYLVNFIQFPSHFSVITKFMLFFSERYFSCNSVSVFRNSDAVYVLAFGILMLNTDLYNHAIKNKMTLAQYIQNSRGINDGTDLPQQMLTDIYEKLKENPLVWNKEKQPHLDSSLWSWVSNWITKIRR